MSTIENTAVDNLWQEYVEIKAIFEKDKNLSLVNQYTNTMRKVLILSCGSFFEYEMTEMLKCYTKLITNNNKQLVSFIEKQGIKQKYHTLFDWESKMNPTSQKLKLINS